jgi:hypothetical protein
MSVLMKALEKAAEDRDKTPTQAEAAERELTLEALDANPGASPAYAPAPSRTGAAGTTRTRSSAQINAATVLSARQPSSAGAIAWMQAHPLYMFGGLAAWFLLLYAIYVYVQIAHPGWLIRTPPQPALAASTPAAAPAVPNTALRGPADSARAPVAPADNAPQVPMPSVFTGMAPPPAAAPPQDTARGKNIAPHRHRRHRSMSRRKPPPLRPSGPLRRKTALPSAAATTQLRASTPP